LDPEDVLPTLRRARDFQIVEETGPDVFRFRHGLTRDAMYAEFLGAEVRPRHRAIALALENESADSRSIEALAYHWWAAGDERNAARYNELAGDAAAEVHAHEDAVAFYERVLELPQVGLVARGAILEKIGEARAALSMYDECLAALNGAADSFSEARVYDREATCRARAAITAYTLGLPAPTAPLDEMLARLAPSEFLARSRLHLGHAWIDATFWFPTRAEAHLAHVDARAVESGLDVRLRFHNISAWVAMTVGDIERFRSEHAAWVEAARAVGSAALATAYTNGAMCYMFFALHDDALRCIERALAVAQTSRNRHAEEGARAISAVCYLAMGDLRRARAAIESIPTTSENRVTAALASSCGTTLAAHLDDDAFAAKWFDGFEAAVTAAPEIETGGPFAEMLVRRGRHVEAARLLRRAIPDCELIRGNVGTLLAVA
jgi:tetratricopeptide (TPR) repeat protein